MMLVLAGSADVTTYFHLRLAANGTDATGLTITNIDLQYTRSGVAPTAKVDATALAATDSAHGDNQAIEIDATDQPGLYRVDWPDAAFAAGVREVLLTVKVATAFTETLRVQIVGFNPADGVRLGLTALPNAAADAAGGLPISDAGGLDMDAILSRIGTPTNLGGGTATLAGNLQDIEAQTDDIGAAGAGLTAVPWNAAWDAEIQSEVDDALVAHRLDELLNADSDIDGAAPPTVGSVFHELMTKATGSFTYDQTTDSLEALKDGASPPTVGQIADAVWDETLADHLGVGSTGSALNAAGSAGDPWNTAIPGAYGAGTAGKIVGDNINATISSRASQTSVDDLPTNAELATSQAAADDATLAAIAALNNLSQADIRTSVGLASANLDTQLGDLPTNAELAAALATADDAVLAAIAALNNLSQANIRTAVGLATANLDTQLGDLPTNAELATALGTADDAVLAAIAALNNLSAAQVNAEVLDVLNVDTFAQPGQGTPAATTSIRLMIAYLYKAWRNRTTQTSSQYSLMNDDAVTVDQKATFSDNGTTADRGEIATGP